MEKKYGDILTNKEVEKECRSIAKKHGLTFKKHMRTKVNHHPVYFYEGRKSGHVYRSMLFIDTAYDIACSDELLNYKEI
jgi:hypothetical protein